MALRSTSLISLTLLLQLLWTAHPVEAQDDAFRNVVRSLPTIAPGRLSDAGYRMKAALAKWDRQIARLHSEPDPNLRHDLLGLAFLQRGKLDDAIREFDAVLALQPARSYASDVYQVRAQTSEAAGDLVEAGRAYRLAWEYQPDSAGKAYLTLRRSPDLDGDTAARALGVLRDAYTQILTGHYAHDEPVFSTLVAIPDTFSDAPIAGDGRLARVFSLLAAGKLDEASAALADKNLAAASVDSARDRIARGGAAEREGRLSDARREYAAAIEGTLSGRFALYVGIARLAQVDGDVDGAIDAFSHAVRLNPSAPALRREFAAALVAGGRFDEAFAEFVAALLVAPNDPEVLAAVGQMFLDTDRPADAIAPLRRVLAVKADRYATHYALATALARAGRAEEAAREFELFDRLNRQALEQRRRVVAGQAGPDGPKR
jgi:tetratricopeptide (TPR) repeat protein